MILDFLLFIFLFVLIFYLFISSTSRPRNFPPGPTWLPIVGNLHTLKKLSRALGFQHLALQSLADTYHSDVLGLKIGGDLTVYVQGHRLVHLALTSDECAGRPNSFFIKLRCMGVRRGITCIDGSIWRTQRSFVERHLRNTGYGKFPMEAMVQGEVLQIIKLLEKSAGPVRFAPIIAPSVLSVIWTLATGHPLSRDNQQLQHLLQLLHSRSKAFDMTGGTLSQMPWLRYIVPEWIGYNLLVRLNNDLKDFFTETIQEHNDTWYADRQDDLIYAFITEMKKNDESTQTFTNEQLIMICLDLFFGGATTTSDTLDFVFLEMVLNPEIQEKAFNCLNSAIPDGTSLTYADRYKVPYVEAIIMESQRINNVVPLIAPRRILRDITIDGYHIPKETTLLVNFNSVHHDVEYWGDPKVFRPERFIDKDGKLLSGERLITFGLGKRRCLGELLARQSIFLFFTAVLRKYKICPEPGMPLPTRTPVPGVTIAPQKYNAILELRHLYSLL